MFLFLFINDLNIYSGMVNTILNISCEPQFFDNEIRANDMLFMGWENLTINGSKNVFFGEYTVIISYILFFGGISKMFFSRKNLLFLLLGIEIMMLGIIFSVLSVFDTVCLFNFFNYTIALQILTLVVAESTIGLTLLLLLSKLCGTVKLDNLNKLRG